MEISPFLGTLLGNALVAIGILISVFIVKYIKSKLKNGLEYITAVTVGLLLGIIFLGFIPELTELFNGEGMIFGFYVLSGIVLFYILELFIHWHHCKDITHTKKCKHSHSHEHENGLLMFSGTILHNAFHGVILFSAFSVNTSFGIATTIAILLHSIPQNIVNYLMNDNNIKYVYFAAFGGVFGAILTFPFAEFLLQNKAGILAVITGGLLYIALADIFPEFKGKGTVGKKIFYLFFITIGILLFLGFNNIVGGEHNHTHEEHTHEEHTHEEHTHEEHSDEEHSDEEHSDEEHDNLNGGGGCSDEMKVIKEGCAENNGEWIHKIHECEGVSQDVCENLGGEFNECASACRNDPEAAMCTMQCVQVCEFNK